MDFKGLSYCIYHTVIDILLKGGTNVLCQMMLSLGEHLLLSINHFLRTSKNAIELHFIIVNVVSYPFQGKPYVENGRQWAARDIGLTHKTCAWMPHGFMSVNTDIGAGRAFLRSLYRQYADWGVDFGMLFLNLYFSLV